MATTLSQPSPARRRSGGLAHAVGVYLAWGLIPLYMRLLSSVSAFEFVAWRVIFSVPVCLLLVVAFNQVGEVRAAFRNPRALGALAASALLIGANWTIYVGAVLKGHVLATSLGYYINPLVNVLLGTIFLGERLGRTQWIAVILATAGVALMAWESLAMLWISLALAGTFAGYGFVRKLAPSGALPGLAVESLLLAPVAVLYLLLAGAGPHGLGFGSDLATSLLLAGTGPITVLPLIAFAEAARRLDLSVLGFVQYLTPTITFLLGVFAFGEPLRPVQLGCFALIWLAIGLFTRDLLARRRTTRV